MGFQIRNKALPDSIFKCLCHNSLRYYRVKQYSPVFYVSFRWAFQIVQLRASNCPTEILRSRGMFAIYHNSPKKMPLTMKIS